MTPANRPEVRKARIVLEEHVIKAVIIDRTVGVVDPVGAGHQMINGTVRVIADFGGGGGHGLIGPFENLRIGFGHVVSFGLSFNEGAAYSIAPISQPAPCGLGVPIWSVAGQWLSSAASIAGLPARSGK